MASPKSKQRQVADDVIAAFNAWDIERIMAYRSDDCTQQVLPKSLGRFEALIFFLQGFSIWLDGLHSIFVEDFPVPVCDDAGFLVDGVWNIGGNEQWNTK